MLAGAKQEGTSDVAYSRNQPSVLEDDREPQRQSGARSGAPQTSNPSASDAVARIRARSLTAGPSGTTLSTTHARLGILSRVAASVTGYLHSKITADKRRPAFLWSKW